MIAQATKTTMKIEYTTASLIRCVARQDMPAYGLTEGQVFYLAKSASLGENQYHILPWNYEAMRWDCPCKCGQGYNHQVPCCHTKAASKDCKQPHTLQGFKPMTRGEKFALLLVKYDIRFQTPVIEAEEVAEVAFSKPIESVEEKKARLYAEVEAHTPGYITSRQEARQEREARYAEKMQAILKAGEEAEAEIARLEAEKRNQAPLNGRQGFQLMR